MKLTIGATRRPPTTRTPGIVTSSAAHASARRRQASPTAATPCCSSQPIAAAKDARAGTSGAPASNRSANSDGISSESLPVPVPPCTSGSGSTPSRAQSTATPPVPRSHLWAGAATMSAPQPGRSQGTCPSDCAASRSTSPPRSWAIPTIAPTSWPPPVTFDAWEQTTKRVAGRQAAAMASGSTRPSESQGTSVTSTLPRVASQWSGRSVAL